MKVGSNVLLQRYLQISLPIKSNFYHKSANENCKNNGWYDVFDVIKPNKTKK